MPQQLHGGGVRRASVGAGGEVRDPGGRAAAAGGRATIGMRATTAALSVLEEQEQVEDPRQRRRRLLAPGVGPGLPRYPLSRRPLRPHRVVSRLGPSEPGGCPPGSLLPPPPPLLPQSLQTTTMLMAVATTTPSIMAEAMMRTWAVMRRLRPRL